MQPGAVRLREEAFPLRRRRRDDAALLDNRLRERKVFDVLVPLRLPARAVARQRVVREHLRPVLPALSIPFLSAAAVLATAFLRSSALTGMPQTSTPVGAPEGAARPVRSGSMVGLTPRGRKMALAGPRWTGSSPVV